jgi:hypothetical protein
VQPDSSTLDTPVSKRRGIFYGWWIVISGMFANFAYAEQFNSSYGVFVHEIGADTGWSRTALAGVQSIGRIPEVYSSVSFFMASGTPARRF